jgi:alkylated DNA repair dioxygenase AlkB
MSLHQPDLFAPTAIVPGLRLEQDFLTQIEEAELIARIRELSLAPFKFQSWEGKRLTTSFGYSYDFERGKVERAPPLPGWLIPLRNRAAALAEMSPAALHQALLIRYDPGAGIGWHRDRPQFDRVIGISLGSEVVLRLRQRTEHGFERHAVPLPPRSIYLLSGEVRREWEHSIVPVESTRFSITFRSLL